MVHIMGAQMQNAHITEMGFTGQRDFTIVQNWLTSSGPPSTTDLISR
jgi:hypothetical protein